MKWSFILLFINVHRNLADVDKDGKLKAEEFILAMHLVDMAKEGQSLPLALPMDFVPPSLRYNKKMCQVLSIMPQILLGLLRVVLVLKISHLFIQLACRGHAGDSLNGSTSSSIYASLAEEFTESDPPQKFKNNSEAAHHTQHLLCTHLGDSVLHVSQFLHTYLQKLHNTQSCDKEFYK